MFSGMNLTGGKKTKRRGSRKAAKRSSSRKRKTQSKRKSSRKSSKKRSGKRRKLNQFFSLMMAAKKKGSPSFVYKGKTYYKKEKNGMTYYKA